VEELESGPTEHGPRVVVGSLGKYPLLDDRGQRDAQTEEDGEEESRNWDVVTPRVAHELGVRHQVSDHVTVFIRLNLRIIAATEK